MRRWSTGDDPGARRSRERDSRFSRGGTVQRPRHDGEYLGQCSWSGLVLHEAAGAGTAIVGDSRLPRARELRGVAAGIRRRAVAATTRTFRSVDASGLPADSALYPPAIRGWVAHHVDRSGRRREPGSRLSALGRSAECYSVSSRRIPAVALGWIKAIRRPPAPRRGFWSTNW